MSSVTTARRPSVAVDGTLVGRLRGIALRGLQRMYLPREQMFCFCVRRGPAGDSPEGISQRYTAITLLALASEPSCVVAKVLGGDSQAAVCERLQRAALLNDNLGDVALALWALAAQQWQERTPVYERLCQLEPGLRPYPTVELAWALTALTLDDTQRGARVLRDAVARRLLSAFEPRSGLLPHHVGSNAGFRGHVACFADIVYPVQALAHYYRKTGDATALDAANQCATRACLAQGPAGQWWWHYDVRTGAVVEPYPVYAVHQDGMAPMALRALADAGGNNFHAEVARGLCWLERTPELGGQSLIDDAAGMIWRKVARHEPRKLARKLQAAASRLHPAFRLPGLDTLLPPGAVDGECRPYHLAWLLYAWSPRPSHGAIAQEEK